MKNFLVKYKKAVITVSIIFAIVVLALFGIYEYCDYMFFKEFKLPERSMPRKVLLSQDPGIRIKGQKLKKLFAIKFGTNDREMGFYEAPPGRNYPAKRNLGASLAFDDKGNCYVLDWFQKNIKMVGKDGKIIKVLSPGNYDKLILNNMDPRYRPYDSDIGLSSTLLFDTSFQNIYVFFPRFGAGRLNLEKGNLEALDSTYFFEGHRFIKFYKKSEYDSIRTILEGFKYSNDLIDNLGDFDIDMNGKMIYGILDRSGEVILYEITPKGKYKIATIYSRFSIKKYKNPGLSLLICKDIIYILFTDYANHLDETRIAGEIVCYDLDKDKILGRWECEGNVEPASFFVGHDSLITNDISFHTPEYQVYEVLKVKCDEELTKNDRL